MLRNSDGNTLVELIALIGILGAVAGSALPHFDSRREAINTSMRTLIGEFRTARTDAITTGRHYSLNLADSRSLRVQRHEEAADGTWPVEGTPRAITLPGNVTWWMVPDTVEFNTRGAMITASDPVFVYVTDSIGSRVHAFSVWPSGQVHEEY
jgi:Tfp pilus assembly protein FimT